MNPIGHDDDIEVDCCEVTNTLSRYEGLSPAKRLQPWQKEKSERNDSGFHSQELDSARLNSDLLGTQQLTFTDDFRQLDITDAEPKQVTPSISLSANPHTSSLKHDTESSNFTTSDHVQENTTSDIFRDVPTCDAIDIFSQDEDGDTQLHMAIIQLSEPAALLCIKRAPVNEWLNFQNTMCQSPLHLAVITRQLMVVRRLMAAGASVKTRDLHGNTPLHIACREGHKEIVSYLLKPIYYEETLENMYDIPYQRIPQDLEYKNYDGHTCLHLAAQNLHIDVMALLLNKGAKVNTQDGKSGRTVLHYAAETGNDALLEFILRQRKVNINSVTYGGLTPIALAAGRGYTNIVTTLKDAGADYSSLYQMDDDDSDDSEMYDDFCINGEPVSVT